MVQAQKKIAWSSHGPQPLFSNLPVLTDVKAKRETLSVGQQNALLEEANNESIS